MNRRQMLFTTGAALMGLAGTGIAGRQLAMAASDALAMATTFGHDKVPTIIGKIERSDKEWKMLLGAKEYSVLRHEGTERAFSSPHNDEKRVGTFHCSGCDLPLYRSETKFDSGTGWPSFYEAIKGTVGTKIDKSFFSTRTEVHCVRCNGHQGHIFTDGPKPTGNRHCINGVALKFKPDTA